MKSRQNRTKFLLALMALAMQLLFINCSGKGSQDNSSQTSSRMGNDINTFSKNPPLLEGETGFQFLLEEYFAPHCGSCHDSKYSFGAAYFDLGNRPKSYDLSKTGLVKQDMIMRVTNNPFCPTCKLNPNGEVYQAIIYWLDHR